MLAARLVPSSGTFTVLISALTSNLTQVARPLRILTAYRGEYEHALTGNWDQRGAAALSRRTLDLADELISRYATTEHLVEVTPGRDGSLSFVWDDENGRYIYLDVGPNDTVHLYYDVIGEPKWEGVSIASDPQILGKLARAFGSAHWPLPQMVE